MNDLLSVVMPVYNTAPELLDRSVGSLTGQTYKNLEVILVDDGSKEETAEKLDELAAADPRICAVHQKNRGASAARNTGIRMARGRFLTMMDSDDSIAPEAYGNMIRMMRRTGAAAGVFGSRMLFKDGRMKNRPVIPGKRVKTVKPGQLLPMIAGTDHMVGGGFPWNKVWDLSKVGKKLLFDEELFSYEDKLWCIRMYRKCSEILLVPQIYYNYFQAENSLSRTADSHEAKAGKRRNAIKAYDRITEELRPYTIACFAAVAFRLKLKVMGKIKGNW